jgi:hypothetical protein
MLATFILTASIAAAADLPPIEAIAPQGTFLAVSAKDLHASWQAIRAGQLGKLYDDPKLKELMGDDSKELEKALDEAAKDLGIERKDLVLPGRMGVAVFGERDEELDAMTMAFIVVADFDDRADSGARMLMASFEKGAKEAEVKIEKAELDGKEVWVIPMGKDEAEDVGADDEFDGMGMDMGAFGSGPDTMYFMRDGENMFLASSMASLEEALLATQGKGKAKTLGSSDDWRGNAALLGTTDMSVTLLTGPLQDMLGPMMMGPMAMVQPAIASLFGDIRTWSIGFDMQPKDGILEMSGAAFIPGKKDGLVSLLAKGQPVGAPPKLLGNECVSYSCANVGFAELWKTIEAAVASLPEMQAEQLAPTLTAYEPIMTKALAVMGPSIHGVQWADANAETGMGGVTAIACSDEKAGMPMLQMFAPSVGLMPRDFQGATIFSGDLVPFAVGLGSGQMLMGQSSGVEQALRAASDKDTKGIAELPIYKRCAGVVAKGGVSAWGFTDTAAQLEAQKSALAKLDGMQDGMDGFVDDAGNPIDDIVTDEAMESMQEMMAKFDAELMKKYLGPSVWWITPADKGFSMRARLLMP